MAELGKNKNIHLHLHKAAGVTKSKVEKVEEESKTKSLPKRHPRQNKSGVTCTMLGWRMKGWQRCCPQGSKCNNRGCPRRPGGGCYVERIGEKGPRGMWNPSRGLKTMKARSMEGKANKLGKYGSKAKTTSVPEAAGGRVVRNF